METEDGQKAKRKTSRIWAQRRCKGFRKNSKISNKIGIEHITVYAFSTENWKRAKEEVSTLMALFQKLFR